MEVILKSVEYKTKEMSFSKPHIMLHDTKFMLLLY